MLAVSLKFTSGESFIFRTCTLRISLCRQCPVNLPQYAGQIFRDARAPGPGVRTVGGGNQDQALNGVKTVHLHQKLIKGLFSFIMAAADSGKTQSAHRVNFIYKDNCSFTGSLARLTALLK